MVQVWILAFGVVLAVGGGWGGLRTARREWGIRREIENAKGVDAGSLQRGVVELAGRAVPAEETFTSPLTGQECVAYELEVEELRRRTTAEGGSSRRWRTVTEEERGAPFYVDDETGRALVDAPVADFELKRAFEVDTDDVATGTAGKLVASITGGDTAADLPVTDERREEIRTADRRRRYHERLIRPDESVYVYGEAMRPEDVPQPQDQFSNLGRKVVKFGVGLLLGDRGSSMMSEPRGYRRTKRRGTQPSDFGDIDFPESSPMEGRNPSKELGIDPERYQEKDPEEMTQAERRRARELSQEATDSLEAEMEPVGDMLDEVSEAMMPGGVDNDPFAGDHLVVSRGDRIGEFVLSDREKGEVLRAYSASTVKWAGLGLVSFIAGGLLIAVGIGVV